MLLRSPDEWSGYSKLIQDNVNGSHQGGLNVHQVLIPFPPGRSRVSRPIVTSWAQYWKRTKFSFLIILIVILVIFFLGRLYFKHVRQLRLDEYLHQAGELKQKLDNLRYHIQRSQQQIKKYKEEAIVRAG